MLLKILWYLRLLLCLIQHNEQAYLVIQIVQLVCNVISIFVTA